MWAHLQQHFRETSMTHETDTRAVPASDSRLIPSELGESERQLVARFLVLKALLGLLAFDVLGFGRNFERMHRFVRTWRLPLRQISGDEIGSVCEAINYACVWYPKRVLCLQRSVVTTCLLRHCGIPAEMVIGAQTIPFKAHAWTEVDGRPINERRDVRKIYSFLERC
jgi:hypothetical protein